MIRVLVVDDHPVLRAGLEAVLRAEPGFRCVGGAENGSEMWTLLRRGRPDVVVLDHRLGDEDGIELCLEIREAERNASEFQIGYMKLPITITATRH